MIPVSQINFLCHSKLPALPVPKLIEVTRSWQKRKFLGFDGGISADLYNRRGYSFALHYGCQVKKWLGVGLRAELFKTNELSQFILNPEIVDYESEKNIHVYVRIIPLRLNKFDLSLDGGFGYSFAERASRTSDNASPNQLVYTHDIKDQSGLSLFTAINVRYRLLKEVNIGVTYGINPKTETSRGAFKIEFAF